MKIERNKDLEFGRKLKSGNVKAYEQLIDLYYQQMCGYAYTLIHDHTEAEDIVQNVFVKLWEKRAKIKPELSIKSLLYKSIYNEFIDSYRKNKAVTKLELKYIEVLSDYVENQPENLEIKIKKVYEVIEKLPPKCKEVFLLNKKEGLSHTEISEYLQISIKAVEWHITKAFKQLRKNLNQDIDTILFLLFGHIPPRIITD
ncbi:RNA polymerase sigma factor [Maribacter sp. LLG6340-A2]|uniref:RNA polymerase sigma factor n=1 Tax=Maribacter sp. LLG6340-A2 TaxID=3160834 RepID=UPI00386DF77D